MTDLLVFGLAALSVFSFTILAVIALMGLFLSQKIERVERIVETLGAGVATTPTTAPTPGVPPTPGPAPVTPPIKTKHLEPVVPVEVVKEESKPLEKKIVPVKEEIIEDPVDRIIIDIPQTIGDSLTADMWSRILKQIPGLKMNTSHKLKGEGFSFFRFTSNTGWVLETPMNVGHKDFPPRLVEVLEHKYNHFVAEQVAKM